VVSNGITFSEKAHKEFHKKYGFKNNTEEQLKKLFLKMKKKKKKICEKFAKQYKDRGKLDE